MKFFLALAALFGAGLLLAAPASAHATVVTSTPRDGTRVAAVPRTVTVIFDEDVSIGTVGYLHVIDQTGKRVDAGAAYHPGGDGTKVADNLVGGLGDGTYTASFRVISQDSHPVAGSIRFVVGNGPLAHGSVATGSGNAGSGWALDAARWISYSGLALLGGAWLLLTVWAPGRDDRRARRLVWTGWAGAALGALLELLLQGPYTGGEEPWHLFSWSLLDGTLHTDYGQLHSVRLALLGLVAFALARALQPAQEREWWEIGFLPVAIGVAYTFSAAGHAETTSPSWVSIVLDMSHLLAMAAWIGGLAMVFLALLPRGEAAERAAVLPVFSKVAFGAVVVLAVSGTYAAWRGIGTVDAILHTDYGLLVMGKVVLFLGLIALGWFSRRIVRSRLTGDGEVIEAERLRRSVAVESCVGLVVLALTAVLVAQPRGKEDLAAQYREPQSATAKVDSTRTVELTVDPGVHGTVTVRVEFTRGTTPKSVTLTASNDAKQLGPLSITLTQEPDGVYDGSVALPVAGRWQFGLLSTFSAFSATLTTLSITLH